MGNLILNLYRQSKERIPFYFGRKSKVPMPVSEKHNDIKESRFEKLLKEYFGVDDIKNITDPVKKMWVEFSLQTVEGGKHVKDVVSQYTPLEGKRYLDIGCGHGGFPLAFKQAGVSEATFLKNLNSTMPPQKALLVNPSWHML